MLKIVLLVRAIAAFICLFVLGAGPSSVGLDGLLIIGAIAYFSIVPPAIAYVVVPLTFMESWLDFISLIASCLLLFGVSEGAHALVTKSLARNYATPNLLTPSRHHETAITFSGSGNQALYLSNFRNVVCGCGANFPKQAERFEAASPDACLKQNGTRTRDDRVCFLPASYKPITEALVSYELSGRDNDPKPVAMADAFNPLLSARTLVITEIIDGHERILGKSFSKNEDLGLVADVFFFAFPGHSWQRFSSVPAGMDELSGALTLQALQPRS